MRLFPDDVVVLSVTVPSPRPLTRQPERFRWFRVTMIDRKTGYRITVTRPKFSDAAKTAAFVLAAKIRTRRILGLLDVPEAWDLRPRP